MRDFEYSRCTPTNISLFIQNNKDCDLLCLINNFPELSKYMNSLHSFKFSMGTLLELINISPGYATYYISYCVDFVMNLNILDILLNYKIITSINDDKFTLLCDSVKLDYDCIEWLIINEYKLNYKYNYAILLDTMSNDKILNLLIDYGRTDILCFILDNSRDVDTIKNIIGVISIADYIEHCNNILHNESYTVVLDIIDKYGVGAYVDIQLSNCELKICGYNIRRHCEFANKLVKTIDDDIVIHVVANLFASMKRY